MFTDKESMLLVVPKRPKSVDNAFVGGMARSA